MSNERDDADDPFADLDSFGSVPPPKGDVHSASTTVAELSDSFIDQLKGVRGQAALPTDDLAATHKGRAFEGAPGEAGKDGPRGPDIRLKGGARAIPRALPAAGRPARGPSLTPAFDHEPLFPPEAATAPRSAVGEAIVAEEAGAALLEDVDASVPPPGDAALAAPPVPRLPDPTPLLDAGAPLPLVTPVGDRPAPGAPGVPLPTPAAWGSPPSDPVLAPAGGESSRHVALASLAPPRSRTREVVLVAVGVGLVLAALAVAIALSGR